MDKKEALKIWEHEFGNAEYAYDFTGRKVKQSDYLIENQVGWVVSYVRPLELGGKHEEGNVIILNHNTAFEKGLNYPNFEVVGVKYIVRYDSKGDYYYIEKDDQFGDK